MSDVLDKGDIIKLFLDSRGHEQSGYRPAIIISSKLYNEQSNMAFICPITSNTSPWVWKVILPENSLVQGAVLVDQMRSIDIVERKYKKIAKVPPHILNDVIAKIAAIVDF